MQHSPPPTRLTLNLNPNPFPSSPLNKALNNSNIALSPPHLLSCLNSDASSDKWPTPGPVTDSKGQPCRWIETDLQGKVAAKWLATLGKGIADMYALPKKGQKEAWKLKEFPKDYRLWTYVKGQREDHYLYGSKQVSKFRTPNEFLPHLHWLTSSEPGRCLCKYCSGAKYQQEVNQAMALAGASSPPKRKAPTHADGPDERSKRPAPAAQSDERGFRGPYLNENLRRDLAEGRSNFRQYELVWCQIDDLALGPPNAEAPGGIDIGIKFWPGLCEHSVLCSESKAFLTIDDEPGEPRRKPGRLKSTPTPGRLAAEELQNCQRYRWSIRLLGLDERVDREEAQILPWLFKPVDVRQKFALRAGPDARLPGHIGNGYPCARPKLASLVSEAEALVAFQLALQTAANLEEFWDAHDRYDRQPDEQPASSGQYKRLAGSGAQMQAQPSGEVWFQGVWWGAEKIWLYDVVRLNVPGLFADEASQASGHLAIRERAHFLKIEGIYRDERDRKLLMAGRIFELVGVEHGQATQPAVARWEEAMPEPPAGYEFRQLTPLGDVHHVHVRCVAGRYYSPTARNQANRLGEVSRRLIKIVQDHARAAGAQTLNNHKSPGGLAWSNASLFGYTSGERNFMRCRKWKLDRKECIIAAERLAEQEMILAFQKSSSSNPTISSETTKKTSYHHSTNENISSSSVKIQINSSQYKNSGPKNSNSGNGYNKSKGFGGFNSGSGSSLNNVIELDP